MSSYLRTAPLLFMQSGVCGSLINNVEILNRILPRAQKYMPLHYCNRGKISKGKSTGKTLRHFLRQLCQCTRCWCFLTHMQLRLLDMYLGEVECITFFTRELIKFRISADRSYRRPPGSNKSVPDGLFSLQP